MGSGGAYLGQYIARALELAYVDRQVVSSVAETLDVEAGEVAANCERVAGFWERLLRPLSLLSPDSTYTPPPIRRITDVQLFNEQVACLRRLAGERDCVIVGHGGAYVLPHHDRMVNLYFHAPLQTRVRRVRELYRLDEDEAVRVVEESDEDRRRYFKHMTGRDWACADNYDLAIDTSLYGLDELGEKIVRFVERKLAAPPPEAR
jgi:cytidylate kinase